MAKTHYDDFIRRRITELRIAKNISEHKMSLDLDKSGSYIRGITSGSALPSLKELFNIISYFDMTPAEFFAPLDDANTPYRLMKAQTMRRYIALIPKNFNLSNVLLAVIYKKKGCTIKYLPITFRPRQGGVNSINMKKICKIGKQAVIDFMKLNRIIRNT